MQAYIETLLLFFFTIQIFFGLYSFFCCKTWKFGGNCVNTKTLSVAHEITGRWIFSSNNLCQRLIKHFLQTRYIRGVDISTFIVLYSKGLITILLRNLCLLFVYRKNNKYNSAIEVILISNGYKKSTWVNVCCLNGVTLT